MFNEHLDNCNFPFDQKVLKLSETDQSCWFPAGINLHPGHCLQWFGRTWKGGENWELLWKAERFFSFVNFWKGKCCQLRWLIAGSRMCSRHRDATEAEYRCHHLQKSGKLIATSEISWTSEHLKGRFGAVCPSVSQTFCPRKADGLDLILARRAPGKTRLKAADYLASIKAWINQLEQFIGAP